MSSGGKGGETTTEIPPEFKQRILSAFDRGEQIATTAPMTYMGITQAAPSEATQSSWNQTNDMANMLGLGMASGKPTDDLPGGNRLREMGGQKGYDAHWGYTQELQRQHREYPERVEALNALVPGLLDPANVHRGEPNMFPNVPKAGAGAGGAAGGPGGAAGMSYEQILKMMQNGGFRV